MEITTTHKDGIATRTMRIGGSEDFKDHGDAFLASLDELDLEDEQVVSITFEFVYREKA